MKLAVLADEITATGWRLIGARTHVLSPGTGDEQLHAALHDADVVLITALAASKLTPAALEPALRASRPLVLVISDITQRLAPEDLEQEARRALGVSA